MESKFSQLVWFVNGEGKITCFVIAFHLIDSRCRHLQTLRRFLQSVRSEEIEVSAVDRRKMSYRCFSIRMRPEEGWLLFEFHGFLVGQDIWSMNGRTCQSIPVGWRFTERGFCKRLLVGMRVARIYVRDVVGTVKETVRGLQTDVSFEFSNRWWWHIRCARRF